MLAFDLNLYLFHEEYIQPEATSSSAKTPKKFKNTKMIIAGYLPNRN
jgi:hypothetical protein